jgi:hypothetical protein
MMSRAPVYKRGNDELKVIQSWPRYGAPWQNRTKSGDHNALGVMAGLDPDIHDLLRGPENVDARDKPGHDEFAERAAS